MSLPTNPQQLFTAISQTRASSYASGAAVAFFAYDTVLSFGDEIEYIWSLPHKEHNALCCIALTNDLEPHTSRIRELRMQYDAAPNILGLVASEHSAPSLECLAIMDVDFVGYGPLEIERLCIWEAPRLHTLHIGGCSGWFGAPFSTLRHLIIRN
ncbi:hypothetical protein BDY19DRAFT_991080 [Irpex rosettiformis]|uniref:Uncharacterized protein n=1 Tax=Irpex rosettiformis TaxID=378272 RepID=A0ACB8UDE7_9APHY|nr:hypothetical protein BDY19DRAFT_991080 [Irpex rosettiformis]